MLEFTRFEAWKARDRETEIKTDANTAANIALYNLILHVIKKSKT